MLRIVPSISTLYQSVSLLIISQWRFISLWIHVRLVHVLHVLFMLFAIHYHLIHERIHSFLVAFHILPLDISSSTKIWHVLREPQTVSDQQTRERRKGKRNVDGEEISSSLDVWRGLGKKALVFVCKEDNSFWKDYVCPKVLNCLCFSFRASNV